MPDSRANDKPLYLFGPLCLSSDFWLRGLLRVPPGGAADSEFSLNWENPPEADSWQQQRVASDPKALAGNGDGNVWLSVGRLSNDYYLRFTDGPGFRVSPDAARLECLAAPGTPEEVVRHRLYHTVLPFVLSLRGFLTLHGAAVKSPAGAIAFLGPSGAGKSTLAAAFVARGFPLICDDTLILERHEDRCLALPAYPGLRLCEDSRGLLAGESVATGEEGTHKRLFELHESGAFDPQPVPLCRLYLLDPPEWPADVVQFEPVPAREGFLCLIHHSYPLDIASPGRLAADFADAASLIATGMWRLRIPRSQNLAEVEDAILQHIDSTKH